MKKAAEIKKLKRFLEKDLSHLQAGPYTVWEVLAWVLDEEEEEGSVGGGVLLRENNRVSLDHQG